MQYAYICWDYERDDGWITCESVDNEREAKQYEAYIKVELPLPKRATNTGKCVGIVPAPK
jgi:hypothetical protein